MKALMWTCAIAGICGLAGIAAAGEVQLLTSGNEAFLGVPFLVAIDVTAEGNHETPDFPTLENADVQLVNQSTTSSSSFQLSINGRPVTSSTTTTRYLYQITPHQVGILRIPAIEVLVEGETKRTHPVAFRVTRSETGDLMYLRLVGAEDSVYVGESLDLTLEIWLLPYGEGRDRLDQNDMWRVLDIDASNWGPFADLVQRRRPQVDWRSDRRGGEDGVSKTYYVYELKKRVWPDRAGPLDVSDIRIVAEYPLHVSRTRGIFGSGRRITQSKPIVATIEESPITVNPIPSEGRPVYFTGAIGPHSIRASAAPTDVRVGDPITLNILVSGQGRLESLQAPPLAELPEFAGDFQVAPDTLPGTVEQNRKRFTQSIRPLNDRVDKIPAIPFAYFDTDKEEFVTVYSDAIPLQVEAAEKMSATQIVESGESPSRRGGSLTALESGIEGNYTEVDELLARQGFQPGAVSTVLAAGSPLFYLACVLAGRSRRKAAANTSQIRARRARRVALRRLHRIDAAQEESASQLMAVMLGYLADRLDLHGGLTREEAIAALRHAGAREDRVTMADAVLLDCETAEFGGGASVSSDRLAERVKKCIDALEDERL